MIGHVVTGLCCMLAFKPEAILPLYPIQRGTFKTELKDGWGLTNDGQYLIVTDSSPTLYWVDPTTFKTVKSLVIKDGDHELPWLNEVSVLSLYPSCHR